MDGIRALFAAGLRRLRRWIVKAVQWTRRQVDRMRAAYVGGRGGMLTPEQANMLARDIANAPLYIRRKTANGWVYDPVPLEQDETNEAGA